MSWGWELVSSKAMSCEETEKAQAAARPGLSTGKHDSKINVEVFSARHRRTSGQADQMQWADTQKTHSRCSGGDETGQTAVQGEGAATGGDRCPRKQGKETDAANGLLSKQSTLVQNSKSILSKT